MPSLPAVTLSLDRIGVLPDDSEDVRLQKALLVRASLMFIVAGYIWGIIYFVVGEPLAGLIPFCYALITTLNVIHFAARRSYQVFRFSQLLLTLLLPFFLMLVLGGYVSGSAVIVWAFVSPLGALLFTDPRRAWWWFLGYLSLLVLGGLLHPVLRLTNNLSVQMALFFFVANIAGVSVLVFTLFHHFIKERAATLGLLRREQAKSERLLLNVLPTEIAAVLKDEVRTIADAYDAVSVLFADVVGFTPLSSELAPQEMVELLNEVFSYYDSLVARYGLEKIRTIGDNYMVAAGVPRPRADHAHVLARMALEMNDFVAHTHSPAAKRLQFRIGINSGPAIAGVIGQTKFHYDLWGDMVNIASRMESQGVPGKIQITRATYELIKDDFICTPRGKIEIKGKGQMETWFLEGRSNGQANHSDR